MTNRVPAQTKRQGFWHPAGRRRRPGDPANDRLDGRTERSTDDRFAAPHSLCPVPLAGVSTTLPCEDGYTSDPGSGTGTRFVAVWSIRLAVVQRGATGEAPLQ